MSSDGVLYAPLFYRQLETDKAMTVQEACGILMLDRMSALSKGDLAWWIDHVYSSHKPILVPDPDLTMFTDVSSTVGWELC